MITPMTMAKVTLTLIAAILFAMGIRGESEPLRWAAIAFLSVAVALRWVERFRRKQ